MKSGENAGDNVIWEGNCNINKTKYGRSRESTRNRPLLQYGAIPNRQQNLWSPNHQN